MIMYSDVRRTRVCLIIPLSIDIDCVDSDAGPGFSHPNTCPAVRVKAFFVKQPYKQVSSLFVNR